jgi:hypothetical protein
LFSAQSQRQVPNDDGDDSTNSVEEENEEEQTEMNEQGKYASGEILL